MPRILSIYYDSSTGPSRDEILTKVGYEVSSATNPSQAFDLLDQGEFAMVIIGQSIPTAERRLLFLEINRKWGTPVMLVDSGGEPDPLIRARAHVSDTATPEQIVAAVASVVPQKRSRQPL
ncbi:MAG: hypothetical protein JWO13_109 [Acidobacteriales bacterium]|nr:hypothetical protein [Terriglobales bacterium]